MRRRIITTQNTAIKEEALKILESGETPSVAQLKEMMKKTGLSYTQLIREANRIRKKMKKEEEEAEKEGRAFSERHYLKNEINEADEMAHREEKKEEVEESIEE